MNLFQLGPEFNLRHQFYILNLFKAEPKIAKHTLKDDSKSNMFINRECVDTEIKDKRRTNW